MENNSKEETVKNTVKDAAKVSHFFRKEVKEKIAQHPCYSKNAHKYARMHLPVAPACNIQCNYCNRKYDCSNESRPGVVSNLVDPNGALKQYKAVNKRMSNLSVVGIAGPGDALANPKATFATLKLIRQENPDVQACISTNGLGLVDHIDDLVQAGVNHLTITINCIDAEVGEKIYPWVFFNHKRLRGKEAAQTLIDRQLAGLEAASQAGMLIKVNTVLIPGINDHHIKAVSEKVQALGAMLHNIMPLISEPEHGTYFGLTGQRGPTEEELDKAREESGAHMAQMTHCKQCRADAVGTLGEGCSSGNENTTPEKKALHRVAIATTKEKAANTETIIDTHFGYAEQFEIYELSEAGNTFNHTETRIVSRYCNGPTECIPDDEYKSLLIDSISDCDQVLCSRIGHTPWRQLEAHSVQPNIDYAFVSTQRALEEITDELNKAKAGKLATEAENEVCNY